MQKKTKRALALIIPILALLAVGAGIWLGVRACARSKTPEAPQEPPIPPSLQTPAPSPQPGPSAGAEDPDATAPAMYQLPLVPVWEDEDEAPAPSPTPAGTPRSEIQFEPMTGLYTEACKDFLAVGIENGVATAILLVRLEGETMSILALPAQMSGTVYTLDEECRIVDVSRAEIGDSLRLGGSGLGQSMWNLVWSVKNATGVRAAQYIGLDLSSLPDLLRILDSVQGEQETYTAENHFAALHERGRMQPGRAADFGAGLIHKMHAVSIWELPGMQRATKGKICSGLSVRQLIVLGKALKNVTQIRCEVLPTIESGGTCEIDTEAAAALLKSLYS